MQFLGRDEAKWHEEKLRRQIADRPRPKLVLYYESGQRDYSAAANAIVAAAGAFAEATLYFLFCVSGDGWNDDLAARERWDGTDDGGAQMATIADSTTRPDIDSKPGRPRSCPERSSLLFSLVGTP